MLTMSKKIKTIKTWWNC